MQADYKLGWGSHGRWIDLLWIRRGRRGSGMGAAAITPASSASPSGLEQLRRRTIEMAGSERRWWRPDTWVVNGLGGLLLAGSHGLCEEREEEENMGIQ